MQLNANVGYYAVLVPLLIIVLLHLWRHRRKGAYIRPLMWTIGSMLFACTCVMLTLLSTSARWIFIFNEAKFVGLVFCAPVLVIFYLQFFKIELSLFEKAALLTIPILTVFFVVTNPWHHLFRAAYYVVVDDGQHYFKADNAIWMYVYLGYNYLISCLSILMVTRFTMRRSRAYREQGLLMLAGIVAPFTTSAIITFSDSPDYADVSVISLTITCLICHAIVMFYSPRNMLDRARGLAMMNLESPYVLFNDLDELAECNPAAATMLGIHEHTLITRTQFLERYLHVTGDDLHLQEVVIASPQMEEFYYRVRYHAFTDNAGMHSGSVYLLENITEVKNMIRELNFSLHRDKLTGLKNRLAFATTYEAMKRQGFQTLTLLFISVSNIKFINNTFGLLHGDEVLKSCATVIQSVAPDKQAVAHIEGDAFAMLLADSREADALEFANIINSKLATMKHFRAPVRMMAGVATSLTDTEPFEKLLHRAVEDNSRRKLQNFDLALPEVVACLRAAIDETEPSASLRMERLKQVMTQFTTVLNMEELQRQSAILLAELHDVGKITTPPHLLNKAGPLTLDEWESVKQHTARGYRIAVSTPCLAQLAPEILYHHEHWDGTGYPTGRSGTNIPYLARLLAIVDTYDAQLHWADMPAKTAQEAKEALQNAAGKSLDPMLTQQFISLVIEADNAQVLPETERYMNTPYYV